jgi:hypothetical protein
MGSVRLQRYFWLVPLVRFVWYEARAVLFDHEAKQCGVRIQPQRPVQCINPWKCHSLEGLGSSHLPGECRWRDHPDPCCVVGNENHSSKKRGIMSMKNCRQSPVVSQSAIDKLIPVVLVVVVVLTNYCSSDCGCRCTGIRRSVSGTCCTVDNGGIWISNAVVRAAHFKCGRGFKNGTQKNRRIKTGLIVFLCEFVTIIPQILGGMQSCDPINSSHVNAMTRFLSTKRNSTTRHNRWGNCQSSSATFSFRKRHY